jgi:hypothetical protein
VKQILIPVVVVTSAGSARADEASVADHSGSPTVTVGGYIQPQALYRGDDGDVPDDEDGFRLRRARATIGATQDLGSAKLGVTIEGELSPTFQLLDAYATAATDLSGPIQAAVDIGQVKAPISRQELLSDSALSFPEKAELASLAPGRQIGARVGATWLGDGMSVKVSAGMFNGEGRNQLLNIDEQFLYAARIELTLGANRKLAESDLDGGAYVTVAGSFGHNKRITAESEDTNVLLGADVAGAWNGISGSFEYLQASHDFADDMTATDFRGNGIAAQAAYLLPVPICGTRRLEVGARFEEIDRNDAVAITAPGQADQSLRYYTGAISYYQRGHALKAQLSFSHVVEVEDLTQAGMPATFDNDTVLFQITYRME